MAVPKNTAGAANPIGVFDAGVGDLTVVRALLERLPSEEICYFGDAAAGATRTKRIGVIGTPATIKSSFSTRAIVEIVKW